MNPIARDMLSGLPNQTYREFVARYLLQPATAQLPADPFALDVPEDMIKDVYVRREDVQGEIGQAGTDIIMGWTGSGKTTLFRVLPALPPPQTLVVQLPLAEIELSGSEDRTTESRPVTPRLLARYIFDAYWEGFLRVPTKRGRFLPGLRRDREWMEMLRWFHRVCCPRRPEIPEEFELMAWLKDIPTHFGPPIISLRELKELVGFVTIPASSLPRYKRLGPFSSPCTRIQILIDDTEHLTDQGMTYLLQDVQKFCADLQFGLFVNSDRQSLIESSDFVQQGRMRLYCLPQWNVKELRQILGLRLRAWRGGEFSEDDWSMLIPETSLTPIARREIVRTIVDGALETYERKTTYLDAPIHVLRLARGLVAACAGCWKDQGYPPPLRSEQVRELVTLYWQEVSVQERSQPDRKQLTRLRPTLVKRFDEEELRTLCFDLGVDYDSLPGEGKARRAMELVAYFERRSRIQELVETIRASRPDIDL